ncbi:MAG TPA: glycosyltransferase family 1 protein [Candidatus Saccharimonadales bacterium]|nr:glycosyltransferase family 1 protein [Candidatus Saccharimonadales bacterium]
MGKQVIYIDAGPILSDRLSGIGHLTLNMIRGLLAREDLKEFYEIRLLAPAAKAYLLKQWDLSDVKVTHIPLLARIWNVWPRFSFAPPIDLFLGKGVYLFPNYKRWPLMLSPSITYVHDISFEIFPQFTEPRNLAMLRGNVPTWINKSTLVITDSDSSKKEIIDHYEIKEDKIRSIYCGVDADLFQPASDAEVKAVKKKYGISMPYLFFLSNLEPRKNIVRLIEAMQLLPQAYKKKYALVMVGGMSWQNEEIHAAIDAATQAGWTIIKPKAYVPDEDVPALLTGAEMLVHPALHEGFGIPVAEAMACGTAVVASDIPVLHEVAASAAVYADPENPADIADKIQIVMTDESLRSRLQSAGLDRAQGFTWAEATDRLVGYIKEISRQ